MRSSNLQRALRRLQENRRSLRAETTDNEEGYEISLEYFRINLTAHRRNDFW